MHVSRWLVVGLLCSCGDNGEPPVDPPGLADRCVAQQLGSDGTLVEQSTHRFDPDGRMVETEAGWAGDPPNRWTYGYDELDRHVLTSRFLPGYPQSDTTVTYEPDRIVVSYGGAESYAHDLSAGRTIHVEGPLEAAPENRSVSDHGYDAAGRLATTMARFIDPEAGPGTSSTAWTYDAEARIATMRRVVTIGSYQSDVTFSFSYTATAGGWMVTLSTATGSRTASFDLDSTGRLVRSAIDEDGDGTDDWSAAYSYDDEAQAIDATDTRGTSVRVWRLRGACAAPRVSTEVRVPAPLYTPAAGVQVPDPGYSVLNP